MYYYYCLLLLLSDVSSSSARSNLHDCVSCGMASAFNKPWWRCVRDPMDSGFPEEREMENHQPADFPCDRGSDCRQLQILIDPFIPHSLGVDIDTVAAIRSEENGGEGANSSW
jgi:hypothetical protein